MVAVQVVLFMLLTHSFFLSLYASVDNQDIVDTAAVVFSALYAHPCVIVLYAYYICTCLCSQRWPHIYVHPFPYIPYLYIGHVSCLLSIAAVCCCRLLIAALYYQHCTAHC